MADIAPQDLPRPESDRRQIEFAPLESHDKRFEAFMVGFALLCVVIVLVIVLATDIGNTTR